MKHKCDPLCIYYPEYPNTILREYTDEFGLKHQVGVYSCIFDEHRILKFDECENYKTVNLDSGDV